MQYGLIRKHLHLISISTGFVGDAINIKMYSYADFPSIVEKIDEMESWEGAQLNEAKEILAYELTTLVHGEEEAKKAQRGCSCIICRWK